ncbi:MAG: hypothetical protein L3J93_02940 [Thermoplasmata archaeon]|nr:hypothetical protein [Thermoplasmata archaeon]
MRNRCVALATLDAVLYEELASELRARGVPSVSIVPGARIPSQAAVVLTSPSELGRISHGRVFAVTPDGDRTALWAAVEHALQIGQSSEAIVVGIDPGPRPGYAIFASGRCLVDGTLESPESTGHLGSSLRQRFPGKEILFRVGSQDRLARDRILRSLASLRKPIELVDESGTTPRGHRRPRDAIAARAIAHHRGKPYRVETLGPVNVTAGDITNLQRVSREGSGGLFTIPKSEASRVLKGELTLSEALAESERRFRRGGAEVRRSAGERDAP